MDFADLMAVADSTIQSSALAGPVTYTPGVGAAVAVRGVFDAAHVQLNIGEPGVSTQGPAVFLTLADLPSNPETDEDATVTVAGVTYTPHTVKPDGLGAVLLLLHRVI